MAEEIKKWKPKTGQTILSIGSEFSSLVIRVLSNLLYRLPFALTLSHVGKVVDSERSIEASAGGVTYYNIKEEYEKAKRIIVFEHPFYEVDENREAYLAHCEEVAAKDESYGYVNYFLWYFGLGVLYFPLAVIFANPWWMKLILLGVFIVIYFPLSRIFKKLRVKTKICSELIARIDQDKFGIELGCIDPEHFSPNEVWQSYKAAERWTLVMDIRPDKVNWSDYVDEVS